MAKKSKKLTAVIFILCFVTAFLLCSCSIKPESDNSIAEAKISTKAEIETLYNSVDISLYDEGTFAEITVLKEQTLLDIDSAQSIAAIGVIKEGFISAINSKLKLIKVSDFAVLSRKKITFKTNVLGLSCLIGDVQYISTVEGVNEVEIELLFTFMKLEKLTLKKEGYRLFEQEFKYRGINIDTIEKLAQVMNSAVEGDVFISETDLEVPENMTITIPKNVILILQGSMLNNRGRIICKGEIQGTVTGNKVEISSEVIPGEDI